MTQLFLQSLDPSLTGRLYGIPCLVSATSPYQDSKKSSIMPPKIQDVPSSRLSPMFLLAARGASDEEGRGGPKPTLKESVRT